MKKFKLAWALFALVSSIFIQVAMAQTTTTGEVNGVVGDPNGAVVPNVSVTLSGPNLIRPLTVTSSADGVYRFSSVPPGRYTIETAGASGFAAFKQENVEVNLGRTTTANIGLTAAGTGASGSGTHRRATAGDRAGIGARPGARDGAGDRRDCWRRIRC